MNPKISVAFRFHGSFYHSYRGDTPDELGFGKDIRIIRHLIDTLDELNRRGIPVRGTWDFENYFSLEKIMPAHCPELIAGLQSRIRDGDDEMQLMSYNNGLISAHTAREFEQAIRRGVSNPAGSGLRDLFGDGYFPMVRPQEMMFTPIHLKLYPACGVDSVSLFYSALPFNGFSNFIPPLSFAERYNPLSLTYPGIAESMTLLPCYNTGDLADHLTLRRWVKAMRRQQLQLDQAQDLLLLIDMDADDDFWVGYDVPILSSRFATARGLQGLVENIHDLDYIVFSTPYTYLQQHPPLKTVTIGQDTADGSFDGLSSWAEKWSNQRMWTGLERARILELQTHRLLESETLPQPVLDSIQSLLDESFEMRLRILSTTHFGMAAPVLNLTREGVGRDLVLRAVETAAAAFEQARRATPPVALDAQPCFALLDYPRGDSTGLIYYPPRPSRALARLPLRASAPAQFTLRAGTGRAIPSAALPGPSGRQLLFVDSFDPAERKLYRIEAGGPHAAPAAPVIVQPNFLENERLRLRFDSLGWLTGVRLDGQDFSSGRFLSSGVTYAGETYAVERWVEAESLALGVVGLKRMRAEVTLPGGYPLRFEREILLAAGLPYIYVTMKVEYPHTPHKGYSRGKAQRLQQTWDASWQEVMPCEIRPDLAGEAGSPLRVWKHNYCDHVSTFSLDYGRYSKNVELNSVNNQITHAWTAVSDGLRGLLVAQNADIASGMAFCPLRTRLGGERMRLLLNPFGSYSGRQYRYASADTGLGNLLAVTFSASDHINPYAPSYNGRTQEFSLLIALYCGDAPPQEVQHDAEAYAYPFLVLNDDVCIAAPPHRSWDGRGLGEALPDIG